MLGYNFANRTNRSPMPMQDNSPPPVIDDAELLERWRSGDKRAGHVLFRRYYDDVQRFFMNKVSSGVADLVQDTFAACVAGRERIKDNSKFRSYLFCIAHRVLYDLFRKQYQEGIEESADSIDNHDDIDWEHVASAELSPGPNTVVVQREEQRVLLEGLRRIPIPDQVVLELHYWEQLSMTDIAEVMKCPRNTVKGRVRRARDRLKRVIEKLAHSPELLSSTLTRLDDWAMQIRQKQNHA